MATSKKKYAVVENPSWPCGYKVFPLTDEIKEMVEGLQYRVAQKASDIEEGDEVIAFHRKKDTVMHGIGEITTVDYSSRKPFTVFFGEMATEPGTSFQAEHGDILYKFVKQ